MNELLDGILISWFEKRGFGFIGRTDSTDEVFCHITDLPEKQPLPKNARVSFELGSLGGRPKAINVRVRP